MAKDPKDKEREERDEYYRRAFENQPRVGLLTPRRPPKPPPPPPEPPPRIQDYVGPLRIRVVEDATGKPISNVKISFWGSPISPIYTNAEGIAERAHAEGRTYIAECRLGNKPLSQTLDYVGEGETPIHPQEESVKSESSASPDDSSQPMEEKKSAGLSPGSSSRRRVYFSEPQEPELLIARVIEYKVKTGDTLLSIGLSKGGGALPIDVSCFNWGVLTDKETQEKLREVVGCTKKDEDGDYVLDDGDDPGIIYLCKKWEMPQVHINEMRTVRVRRIVAKKAEKPNGIQLKLLYSECAKYLKENAAKIANCVLKIGETEYKGVTDDKGVVAFSIPRSTGKAILLLDGLRVANISIDEIIEGAL